MKNDTFTEMCKRMSLLGQLGKCTDKQITMFERLFSPYEFRIIDDAVEQMPRDRLDWAAEALETELSPANQLELV